MKSRLLLALLAVGVLLASCMPRNRTVEDPLIATANTQTLDIRKIELSDTATILHVDAYYRPHNWIRIVAGTYLQADGRKYMVQGSEGIQLDSLFWMPDSGEASFVLKFGPLPRGTKSFDFIESDCDDCFKLYGIDLTGKKEYSPVPEGLPEALKNGPKDGVVPGPILKVGQTTLNVHLLGYRDGMSKEVEFYANSLLGGQKRFVAPIDPKTGIAKLEFEQYATWQMYIMLAGGGFGGNIWTAPGETADVYIDLRQEGRKIVQRRNKDGIEPVKTLNLYSTGTYGDLNMYNNLVDKWITLDCFTGNFADYRMSADEYTQMVGSKYKVLADSIARSESMPGMLRELLLLSLQQETLTAMVNGPYFLEHNYRMINNLWDRNAKLNYKFAKFAPEHYAVVCELFDIADPKLMMGRNLSFYSGAVVNPAWLTGVAGITDGVVAELPIAVPLFAKAENNELTTEDLDALYALRDPFYAEACEAAQARVRKELEQMQNITIETTPNVSDDRLFETIVAPYKGKVVFVDFWNTWCSPCRASIKANEPLKTGELKSDDLVWIYIANETSPLVTYKTSIAEIQGKHYRLNQKQWDYLCKQLEIDGIPSYVLVEKDGAFKLRNEMRDHTVLETTLKEKIK